MEKPFAACAPGLESLLAAELTALGLRKPAIFTAPTGGPSGLEFDGGEAGMRRAALCLRTAERVLLRLPAFAASSFDELLAGAARVSWERFLAPGAPIAVRADSRRSKLYHERGIGERIAKAASRRLKKESPLVKPEDGGDGERAQLVYARLDENECVLSIDASGAPLHRRGWRLETAKAPLKETLAAALLLASRWDRSAPLVDPFCGSGTIVIEAALMAAGAPAGSGRRFAFMDWPGFDENDWKKMLAAAISPPASPFPLISASDRDPGAVAAARANAARAGVEDKIAFSCRALSDIEPPARAGWIVTNPPYGVRIGDAAELRALYARLGGVARELCPSWNLSLLSAGSGLLRATGLGFDASLSTLNGGIPVRLAVLNKR